MKKLFAVALLLSCRGFCGWGGGICRFMESLQRWGWWLRSGLASELQNLWASLRKSCGMRACLL